MRSFRVLQEGCRARAELPGRGDAEGSGRHEAEEKWGGRDVTMTWWRAWWGSCGLCWCSYQVRSRRLTCYCRRCFRFDLFLSPALFLCEYIWVYRPRAGALMREMWIYLKAWIISETIKISFAYLRIFVFNKVRWIIAQNLQQMPKLFAFHLKMLYRKNL